MDLFQRSIDILLANQHSSGAYVACPAFPVYQFCWFRDASYVAYALDCADQSASAARYHAWAARTLLRYREPVRRGLRKLQAGQALEPGDYIHTRYHLNGSVETDGEWPNFQLDGIGTWLWSLAEHHRFNGTTLAEEQCQAVELCVDYLLALWDRPCYDCWEERPDQLHTYTLGALYQGLACFADIRTTVPDVLAHIRSAIQSRAVHDGHLIKDLNGSDEVDGNLIALAVPNSVYAANDPIIRATIARIEADLCRDGGGVHRYAADTYYGGGEWVLLTAWLGWYYAHVGAVERARQLLAWIEAQADEQGHLPEQVAAHLNQPAYLAEWRQRWGESARPLLWSHAAYIILRQAIERVV
ncbi:MAG TPA: glycoside hydrolase family 15 protein [Anaerolineae bacterium]|nr:glycoside hydrolase family 15 protein [Anaerolineae bacterium]